MSFPTSRRTSHDYHNLKHKNERIILVLNYSREFYIELEKDISAKQQDRIRNNSILASVSFWPLLIIELMARAVTARLIVR